MTLWGRGGSGWIETLVSVRAGVGAGLDEVITGSGSPASFPRRKKDKRSNIPMVGLVKDKTLKD